MRTILFYFAAVSAALIQPIKGTTIGTHFEFEAVKEAPLGVEVGIPMGHIVGHLIFISGSVGQHTIDPSGPDNEFGYPAPAAFTHDIRSGANIYIGITGYVDKENPVDIFPYIYPYHLMHLPLFEFRNMEISYYELELTLAEETPVDESPLWHVKYSGTFRIVGERKPVPDSGKTLLLLGLGSLGLMARRGFGIG